MKDRKDKEIKLIDDFINLLSDMKIKIKESETTIDLLSQENILRKRSVEFKNSLFNI